MNLYLPDTNIFIFALTSQQPFLAWLERWVTDKALVLSSMVVAEFLSGAELQEEITFRELLATFPVLPIDRQVAELAAEYRKGFLSKHKKVWLSDCFIAATCKLNKATLVTFNTKDFPMTDIEVVDSFSLR
ncbi:type II toxin-antitoxin system VapC family toxin [Candidatus Woesebacteria bacterium]|nr:type II toxin-antitoxin system VapC family toxin [Candidatus Woesebacteria bacterium]